MYAFYMGGMGAFTTMVIVKIPYVYRQRYRVFYFIYYILSVDYNVIIETVPSQMLLRG